MKMERSITGIEDLIGQQVQVLAFGTSYVGILREVDHEHDVIILEDGKDRVSLDLERIESFALA